MSRRLGDDPLTRARSERAKAAGGSTTEAVGSGGQEATAQVGIQTSSRASYNDVFFQRRGEDIAPQQAAADAPGAPEAPEISEISEIPEIREAAAVSGSQEAFDATAGAKAASLVAQDTQVMPAPPVSIIEEVVAKLNGAGAGTAAEVVATPQAKEEPSAPTGSQATNGTDGSTSEPQKGGFFKRLFGKFK